jgi:Cu/Ag efflux pump CusA
MERSNELMEHSIAAVQANTAEIQKSTQMMSAAPLFGLLFIVIVFTPIFTIYRKLRKK